MASVAYRKLRREKQLRRCAAMRAAKERHRLAVMATEPVRVDRTVEIVIRDSHRPMTSISLRAIDCENHWGRWQISMNGRPVSITRLGPAGLARMLAGWLR